MEQDIFTFGHRTALLKGGSKNNAGSGVGLSINHLTDALQRTMNMAAYVDVTASPWSGCCCHLVRHLRSI
jgi:hypothetical protein